MRTSRAQKIAAIRQFIAAHAAHDRDHVARDVVWTMPRDCTVKASSDEISAQPGGHQDGDGYARIEGQPDPFTTGAGPTPATAEGDRR